MSSQTGVAVSTGVGLEGWGGTGFGDRSPLAGIRGRVLSGGSGGGAKTPKAPYFNLKFRLKCAQFCLLRCEQKPLQNLLTGFLPFLPLTLERCESSALPVINRLPAGMLKKTFIDILQPKAGSVQ